MGVNAVCRASGAVLLTLCVLLAACGDEPRSVAPREQPAKMAEPAPVAESAKPPGPPPPTPVEVDSALRALEADDSERRRRAVTLLLRGDHTYREITHLALRAVRLERDVGLLADLLSDHPEGALPYVLHRVTHAAALQRAQICRALGRARKSRYAAISVLLVRALLDPEAVVRGEARLALSCISAAGVRTLDAHDRAFPRGATGSLLYVSAALLYGPGELDVRSPYRRAVHRALEADAARFGVETERAVAFYKDELSGLLPPWDLSAGGCASQAWRAENLRMAEHLADAYARGFRGLDQLLLRPRYLGPVLRTYTLIGERAIDDAPILLAAWRSQLLGDLDPTGALDAQRPRLARAEPTSGLPWRLRPGEVAERGRAAQWYEMLPRGVSATAALALVRLGNRSPGVLDGLWGLLALELNWYDRALVEVTLQLLRPRGELVHAMLRAVRPRPASELSRAAVASARAILPWTVDEARLDVWQKVRLMLDQKGVSRPGRIRLRQILREYERLDSDVDKHVLRLAALLERHVTR